MGQVQNISHQTHRERQSALPVPKRSTLGEMGRKQNKRKRILCRSHLLVVGARVDQGSAVDTWRPWICFSELHPFPRGRRGKLGAAGGAGGGRGGSAPAGRGGNQQVRSLRSQQWIVGLGLAGPEHSNPGWVDAARERKEEVCACLSLTAALRDGVFTQGTGQGSPVPTRSCQLHVCILLVKHLWTSCLL